MTLPEAPTSRTAPAPSPAVPRTLRVALAQTGQVPADRASALRVLLQRFRSAAEPGTDLVVFPELATTPYFGLTGDDAYKSWAEPVPGATSDAFAAVAAELGVGVVYGEYERAADGTPYNAAVVIDATGRLVHGRTLGGQQVPCYRKSCIPQGASTGYWVDEKRFFEPGPGPTVFEAFGTTFACLICYDRSFPEHWEAARSMGAEVVLLLVSSFGSREDLFETELRVRAKDAQCWIVAVNRAGEETLAGRTVSTFGRSCVVDPNGEVLASAPAHEQPHELHAELDLDHVHDSRRRVPYQRDKVPAVFEQIAELKRRTGPIW
ncbi:carbon-nitrogen hydrolase family protein [Kineococcus arenarius]|uniref:carbon-nitrogen hydrolase family protein n=1 Tax=Kineococcus sp. SYSU DK007 TaxID=3383128 RepID=UPI003D7D9535